MSLTKTVCRAGREAEELRRRIEAELVDAVRERHQAMQRGSVKFEEYHAGRIAAYKQAATILFDTKTANRMVSAARSRAGVP